MLNDLAKELSEEADILFGNDWNKKDPIIFYALMITEISEAIEESRKSHPAVWYREDGKPEGELVELADTVIRILNLCGSKGWDLEKAIKIKREYNMNKRTWKREGKRI